MVSNSTPHCAAEPSGGFALKPPETTWRECSGACALKAPEDGFEPPPRGAELLAITALFQAAADLHTVLTPHAVAIERAEQASQRLDEYMATMAGIGLLKTFNAEYKRRRAAREISVTYPVALARLRLALVPLLATGVHRPPIGQSVFQSVFG